MSSEESIIIKVVLVGETDVGKTSIILRYATNKFNNNQMSSSCASFISKSITINGKLIKFEIWDTAGQEKYRSVARIFYKDAVVCILVYDITKRRTFAEIRNYWIDEIKSNIKKDASNIYFIFNYKNK